MSQSSVVEGCIAEDNGGIGFVVNAGSAVTRCASRNNTGVGFSINNSSVSLCSSRVNIGGGMAIQNCSSVVNCMVGSNGGNGLSVSIGSAETATVITDSSFCDNDDNGITCGSNAVVRGCVCTGNGQTTATGAGIRVTSGDCRIEGNHCKGNDRGISVANSGSVILRNSCGSNLINWEIAANNVYSPIVDRSAPASPAVSGNSAAGVVGSSDGNVNITF
ncbi:MAG: hypothetical protein QM783_04955 [Phycisphaerales bacterium]